MKALLLCAATLCWASMSKSGYGLASYCLYPPCSNDGSSDVIHPGLREPLENPCENKLQCPSHMICYSWRPGNYSCYCPDLLPPDPYDNSCPSSTLDTYLNNVNLITRKYYYVYHHDKVSFDVAMNLCALNDGILATIPDQETLNDLENWPITWRSASNTFIGLRETLGSWKWSNGSGLTSYRPEAQGRGCNYGGCSCVDLNFETTNCAISKSFICQHQYNCNLKDLVIPHAEYPGCSASEIVEGGYKVMFQCEKGFLHTGHNYITCVPPGMWNITLSDPPCIPVCNPPEPIVNADILDPKPFYPIGKEITGLCKDGYFASSTHYPRTHFVITCLAGGVWKTNVTRCLPFSGLHCKYHHFGIENDILEVQVGETAQLPCANAPKTSVIARKWLKNQNDIATDMLSNKNYMFNKDNGLLTITNISHPDEGLFTCILMDDQAKIKHVEEYNLQLGNSNCKPQPPTSKVVELNEGESVLLSCNQPLNAADVIWYKNESRIWGDDHLVLLKDGSLLIEELLYSDKGLFICYAVSSEDGCLRENIIEMRVIAGTNTICGTLESADTTEDLDRHPWFGSLWWDDDVAPFCYGSIISRHWVITSASCLYGFQRRKVSGMLVKFGNVEKNDSNVIVVPVKFIRIHPNYSRRVNANDIGLIRLRRPVIFGRYIRPICVPTNEQILVDNPCDPSKRIQGTVSGLGSLTVQDPEDLTLAAEEMVVADGKDCRKVFGDSFSSIQDNMFCAYKKGFEKGNLQVLKPENLQSNDGGKFAGDSGSPFEVNINGRWFVYGVFSTGDRSASVGNFDYFTLISHYSEWLQQQLRRN